MITISMPASERGIAVEVGALKGFNLAIEAAVEEPRGDDFEWVELRPRYTLLGAAQLRNYSDGLYYNLIPLATLGRIDFAGGLIGLDMAAGLNLSEIQDNYFYDLLIGVEATTNLTFWLEREFVGAEAFILMGSDFVASWGGIKAYPTKRLSIGAGVHYDGELDHWGDTPFLRDKWDNGMNYYLTIGYRFEL